MKINTSFLLIVIIVTIVVNSCDESTKPEILGELRLVLKADKVIGIAPLTINFSAEINGDTTGLTGFVPDYVFYPGQGKTIIRYILPDTLQRIRTWFHQETYNSQGKIKAVLLYQGRKNNLPYDLWSDTLTITVQ